MFSASSRWRLLVVAIAFVFAARADAQLASEPPSGRDIVVAYNRGLHFGVAPGVFIPTRGGEVGFSISGDVRYGFDLGPIILGPGARVAGYFLPHANVVLGAGELRVTVPIGFFAPYAIGGVGLGHVSQPAYTGLAYLAGGGLMVHIGTHFAIGAEAVYQAIRGSNFAALFIGPAILLGF